jgi:hypothetical protein
MVEFMVEPAAITSALVERENSPGIMVMGNDLDWVPQSAVIIVVPIFVPGVKVIKTYPSELVIAVAEESKPKTGVAEKVTVSPDSGLPFTVTRAVMIEFIAEPAATVGLFARSVRSPEETVIDVDCDNIPQSAVIGTIPVSVPGVKVTVAYP